MGVLSYFLKPNVKKMQETGDIDGLINALMHKDVMVKEKAKEALVSLGKSAIDPLVDAMVRGVDNAAEPLDKLGGAEVVKSLTQVLADKERGLDKRARAADALDKRGWKPIDDTDKAHYLLAKQEWNELVGLGERAVGLLVQILKPSMVFDVPSTGRTISFMQDDDVRAKAIDTLVEIGKPAVELLIQALKDKGSLVRSDAADALGRIGDARALEPLTQALKDDNVKVQEAARGALEKITAKGK